MEKSIEVRSEFGVSRSDAAKLVESIGESFNGVPSLVTMPIDRALRYSISLRGNNYLRAAFLDNIDQPVTVVTFLCRQQQHRCRYSQRAQYLG